MKKILSLILSALMIFAILPMSFAKEVQETSDTDSPTITYRAVLSSPIEFPEVTEENGLEQYGLLKIPNKSTLTVMKMEVKDSDSIPDLVYHGNGITFEGWDIDPSTVDFSQLKEDTTFTAYFNNDDSIPVFINAKQWCSDKLGEGKPYYNPIGVFVDENNPQLSCATTSLLFVKPGYVLQEEDMPLRESRYSHAIERYWSSPFAGTQINEPTYFEVTYWPSYTVCFSMNVGDYCKQDYQNIFEGEDALPPEVPEVPGYVFCGWDAPYTNIGNNGEPQSYIYINALFYQIGDCNGDEVINTADAVCVLRNCASTLSTDDAAFEKLADFNGDGVVNTGDAVAILYAAAHE